MSILNLKEFRKELNLSQREAAESIRIDQRQWSRYKTEQTNYRYDIS